MKNKKIAVLICLIVLGAIVYTPSKKCEAATGADYQAIPPFVTSGAPPLVMLVMGRNHKLYYEAYNDASDLNDDGVLDIRYSPDSIDYYGYFDSYKCYEYSSEHQRFEPVSRTSNKKCSQAWSGDFLNYLTMSRMDTLRKVLYGGYRSTDTESETVLERVFIPQDAHSWAKEYTSVTVDSFDISDYAPFQVPQEGLHHLFGSTTLYGADHDPLLRVALNNPHRVWEWASKESPVLDDSIETSAGGHPGHPNDHQAFETMVNTYANSSNLFGSGDWLDYDVRNHVNEMFSSPNKDLFGAIDGYGNPYGNGYKDDHEYGNAEQENYLAVFTGTLKVTTEGNYEIAVDGDDAVEVIIDGGTANEKVIGYYGAHGSCNCTSYSGDIFLSSGNHTVEFRMEEAGGADKYYLYWKGPDSSDTWTIIPNTSFLDLTLSTYRLTTPASNIDNYAVRVKVCDPSVGIEANCKMYPNGNYKPIGILQRHGESKRMYFGLLTGSWAKNTSGGVLRKQVGDISDEIDADTGALLDTNGIIQTINKMRIFGYSYSARNYNQNCGWITSGPMSEGQCRDWGNPIAEMMYETERYFAGKKDPTSAYDYSDSDADDFKLGLPKPDWNDPYDDYASCSKPFMLVLSDINPTYDSDLLPGVNDNFGTGISDDLGGFNAETNATVISNLEGIDGSKYIGQSADFFDGACTAKDVSGLGNIRGLCPEEPTKGGGYYSAAVAYYGHITDLQPDSDEEQKVDTYAVGLASPLPRIELNIGGHPVTLVPFAKTVASTGDWGAPVSAGHVWPYWPTNTIVDFYVQEIGPTSGTFRINYEDVEQGADHDMDDIVTYQYQLVDSSGNATTDPDNATAVDISLTAGYASGSYIQHAGYIISGTTQDGTYLEVSDSDTGVNNDVLVFLDTPPETLPISAACDVDPCRDQPGETHNSALGELPLNTTRRFYPSDNDDNDVAQLLEGPLWYAAKWGSFKDKNNNKIPDLQDEWDEDKDGVPDTYYYVTNPLRLEEQLNKSFADILNRASSGTAASVISNTRSGEGAIYQSVFFPSKTSTLDANTVRWVGQIHALLTDAYGNIREDSNGNHQLDVTGPDLNDDGIVLHEDINMNCKLDTEDTNDNGQLDEGEDLNGNGKLDTEDINGNGVLDVESNSDECVKSASPDSDAYFSKLDAIIEYHDGKVNRYYDVNGNNIIDPPERLWNIGETGLSIDQLKYLWNSSDWLNDSDLDPLTQRGMDNYISNNKERYIFTWVDGNGNGRVESTEIKNFVWPSQDPALDDTNNFYPYLTLYPTFEDKPASIKDLSSLNFDTFVIEQTRREINWIRGKDYVNSQGIPVPLTIDDDDIPGTELRSRQFGNKTWRLGDIAYSTPTLVGRPSEAFHLLYKDNSYADFAAKYQNRRNVIYAGANDGMLHAFNGGFFDSFHNKFCREISSSYNPYDSSTTNDEPCKSGTTMPELGAELWAYVPFNLLPHLYWLTETNYGHIYYVDDKPRIFDAKIFNEESQCSSINNSYCIHPHGWGTVLVVGMRLGGAQISTDVNRDDKIDYALETYTDSNNNNAYDDGEEFIDCNGNNKYDPFPVKEAYNDFNDNGEYDQTVTEPFTDYNNNNKYDSGISEPYIDCNGNGLHDNLTNETFTDTDGDGSYTDADPFTDWNGNGRYDTNLEEPFTDCNLNSSYNASPVAENFIDCNGNGEYDSSTHESFTDTNGDGNYTDADPFTDWNGNGRYDTNLEEPFSDCNSNGVYDSNIIHEPFNDIDGDGHYDAAEPFTDWNGNKQYDVSVDEPYQDYNGNNIHDPNEPYTDWNGNGKYDSNITEPWVDTDGDNHCDAEESFIDCNNNHRYDNVNVSEAFTDWNNNGIHDTDVDEPYTDNDNNGAYTEAEPFVDCNGNGRYDASLSEPFYDCNNNNIYDDSLMEAFTDWNGNGIHDTDVDEPYTDNDNNGAYTEAEPFVDCNGNGRYDVSLSEPFTDWNGNGQYDAQFDEPFVDWNENGQYDSITGETFKDCNNDGVRQGIVPMKSAYIIMDITNPEAPPRLLAELIMPEMGFSTSYPTVVTMNRNGENKWFLAFGSGPADNYGQPDNTLLSSARSDQPGKFYMLDLVKLASEKELWSVYSDSDGTSLKPGLHIYKTLESNSFVSSPVTVDFDMDYNADATYFGTINYDFDKAKWGGKLRRIVLEGNSDVSTWNADSILFDADQPISAAPTVGVDDVGRNWVFFGTGRYFVSEDRNDKHKQSFYGIKEPINDDGNKTWDEVCNDRLDDVCIHPLIDTTNIYVLTDPAHTVAGLESVTNWANLLEAQNNSNGWLLDFYAEDGSLQGERNIGQAALIGGLLSFTTFVPSDDICVAGGESYLWALYYKTGTAYYNPILGTSSMNINGSMQDIANRKISMGEGLTASPSIHTGREKGSVVFVQSSTGEIKRIEEANPLGTKSGTISWKLQVQ